MYHIFKDLHKLVEAIWEVERVPDDWKESLIISIYRNKGTAVVYPC